MGGECRSGEIEAQGAPVGRRPNEPPEVTVEEPRRALAEQGHGFGPGTTRRFLFRHRGTLLRSAGIGTFFGALPGAGGMISAFTSYAVARSPSRTPERFGHGAPEGVIATEAANNAGCGGALIPTLSGGTGETVAPDSAPRPCSASPSAGSGRSRFRALRGVALHAHGTHAVAGGLDPGVRLLGG